jgi:hypothetical protein
MCVCIRDKHTASLLQRMVYTQHTSQLHRNTRLQLSCTGATLRVSNWRQIMDWRCSGTGVWRDHARVWKYHGLKVFWNGGLIRTWTDGLLQQGVWRDHGLTVFRNRGLNAMDWRSSGTGVWRVYGLTVFWNRDLKRPWTGVWKDHGLTVFCNGGLRKTWADGLLEQESEEPMDWRCSGTGSLTWTWTDGVPEQGVWREHGLTVFWNGESDEIMDWRSSGTGSEETMDRGLKRPWTDGVLKRWYDKNMDWRSSRTGVWRDHGLTVFWNRKSDKTMDGRCFETAVWQ